MESGREAIEAKIDHVWLIVAKMVRTDINKGHHETDDLILEGVYAVLRNADHFDPKRGTIATFAWHVAKQWLSSRIFERDKLKKYEGREKEISLYAPVRTFRREYGREMVLGDIIPSKQNLEKEVENRIECERATRCMDKLNELEKHVISRMYLADRPMMQSEIARELNVTPQYVSQIKLGALSKLRRMMRE